jgi:hypothetical protein
MRSPGAGPVVRARKHSAGDGDTPGFIRMLTGR